MLFASEQKQIALMADANLIFASPHLQQIAQKRGLIWILHLIQNKVDLIIECVQ